MPIPTVKASAEQIVRLEQEIIDDAISIEKRHRALFTLQALAGADASHALGRTLTTSKVTDSELLRHEIAYVCGQRQDPVAIEYLRQVLNNNSDAPIVRHEAGEALAAIGTDEALQALQDFDAEQASLSEEARADSTVRDTVTLALAGVAWSKSGEEVPKSSFTSKDPAPASTTGTADQWEQDLGNPEEDLFLRYRALFALRNSRTDAAVAALGRVLRSDNSSALLRHEIAYVLGQMASRVARDDLLEVALKTEEHPMVRHESVEALGAVVEPKLDGDILGKLHELTHKSVPEVVRESAQVAVDIIDHNNSAEFQYADGLQQPESA